MCGRHRRLSRRCRSSQPEQTTVKRVRWLMRYSLFPLCGLFLLAVVTDSSISTRSSHGIVVHGRRGAGLAIYSSARHLYFCAGRIPSELIVPVADGFYSNWPESGMGYSAVFRWTGPFRVIAGVDTGLEPPTGVPPAWLARYPNSVSSLHVRHWVASLVTLMLSAAAFRPYWRVAVRRRRSRRNCCLECGYDLRAHKPGDRCPECGTVVPPQPDSLGGPRPLQ